MPQERLQKIIANAGIASRRAAEELITAGRVSVNGSIVAELGAKADANTDQITVDGKPVVVNRQHMYLVMHKPKGYVTTVSDPEGRPTVMALLPPDCPRVYPVGRLDYLTEGLLLFTNDGDLAYKLTQASSHVPKTYLVKVAGQPTEEDIERLRTGVKIEKTNEKGMGRRVKTAPAQIQWVRFADNPWLEVTLIEGRNRQIRKMFEEVGHHVEKIRRTAYGPIELDLETGALRSLKLREVYDLRQSVLPQKAAAGTTVPATKTSAKTRKFLEVPAARAHKRPPVSAGRPAKPDFRSPRAPRPEFRSPEFRSPEFRSPDSRSKDSRGRDFSAKEQSVRRPAAYAQSRPRRESQSGATNREFRATRDDSRTQSRGDFRSRPRPNDSARPATTNDRRPRPFSSSANPGFGRARSSEEKPRYQSRATSDFSRGQSKPPSESVQRKNRGEFRKDFDLKDSRRTSERTPARGRATGGNYDRRPGKNFTARPSSTGGPGAARADRRPTERRLGGPKHGGRGKKS